MDTNRPIIKGLDNGIRQQLKSYLQLFQVIERNR